MTDNTPGPNPSPPPPVTDSRLAEFRANYHQAAAVLDGLAGYIADWSVRKGFRPKCGLCAGGKRVVDDEGNVESCGRCKGRGWVPNNFAQDCMLVVTELAEMVEGDRRGQGQAPDEHCPAFTGVEVECADAIIRLLDLAGEYGWRIGPALMAKLAFNETRPFKHGKRY